MSNPNAIPPVPKLGEQRALALKTPELRIECYKQYCKHISLGRSKTSFVFNHPTASLTWETMEKYMGIYKDELDPDLMAVAEAMSFGVWETLLMDCASGRNQKANVAAIQIAMRNKFNWDKNSNGTSRKDMLDAMAHFSSLRNFLVGQSESPDPEHIESLENHSD